MNKPGARRVGLILVRHPDPMRWNLEKLASGAAEDRLLAEQGLTEWADMLVKEDHRWGREPAAKGD